MNVHIKDQRIAKEILWRLIETKGKGCPTKPPDHKEDCATCHLHYDGAGWCWEMLFNKTIYLSEDLIDSLNAKRYDRALVIWAKEYGEVELMEKLL